MKNKIISLLTKLFLFFLFTSQINASEQNWNLAKEGNKIILIRHSLAPGGGDPAGFKIGDCKSQRNLSKKGINHHCLHIMTLIDSKIKSELDTPSSIPDSLALAAQSHSECHTITTCTIERTHVVERTFHLYTCMW